jgi:hypothetical protein
MIDVRRATANEQPLLDRTETILRGTPHLELPLLSERWQAQGGWYVLLEPYSARWRLGGTTDKKTWSFALWPLIVIFWIPGALLLRSGIVARRRNRIGTCRSCGYPLAGLIDHAPCPECGTTAPIRVNP